MADYQRWAWIGRHLARLYPLSFAVIPVLHIVAYQPGKASLVDLVLICSALLAGFGLLYLLLAWTLGPTWIASLCVFAGVMWFYGFPYAVSVAGGAVSPAVVALVSGLVTAATVFWLRRRPAVLDKVSRLLVGAGVLMLAWTSLRIGVSAIQQHRAITSSRLLRDLAQPIQPKPHPTTPAGEPSIYLIILDEYANSQILRDQFGFDNHQFEDSLRQLGFTIPRLVRSNYVHTTLSLASLLNFTHLTRLSQELGPTNGDPTLADYLVEHNRTVRFLQSEGYRFVFFPSQWWPATARNRHADWEFENSEGFSLWRELGRTELRRGLWKRSLLGTLRPARHLVDAEYLKKSFEGLRQLHPSDERMFVFAHMILPHSPNVFDSRCRPISAPDVRDRRLYHDQLQCANAMVLELVTELLRRPGRPPLILLQGDHGTAMMKYYSAATAQHISAAQARERFGAFGAYYLPGQGRHLLGDTLTLVNLFPKVLNHYFGAGLPSVPDDLFVSLLDTPLDFVRVDPDRLR